MSLQRDFVITLRRLVAKCPESSAASDVRERIAKCYDIGKVKGRRVIYTSQDIENAKSLLASHGHALTEPSGLVARSEVQAGDSEKWNARPVGEGLVAVVGIGLQGLQITPGNLLVMPLEQALSLPYGVLLFCENLEPMLRLHEYHWLEDYRRGRPMLAVFRGTVGPLGTKAAYDFLRRNEKPLLAFFDFDPMGLRMAADVQPFEELCLPPGLEEATMQQRRANLYIQSVHEARPILNRLAPESSIGRAWALMNRLELGLDQEHFPRY